MKKAVKYFRVVSIGVLVVALATVLFGVTETHSNAVHSTQRASSTLKSVTVTSTGDPNTDEFTEVIDSIHGVVTRVVVDTNGTDTDFTVTLKDENAVTIFSGASLSSADDPNGWAVTEDSIDGDACAGVAITGTMSLAVTDCNDATLNSVSVIIFYIDSWIQ